MFTLLIIIGIVLIIWAYKAQVKAEKKIDAVDANQRAASINRLQQVKFNFRDKSKFEKIIGAVTIGGDSLAIFSYSDRFLFVKYKDGKNFTVNLDQMEVLFRFEPSVDSRSAIITLGSNEFTITEDRDEIMTEREWDTIFNILQCAKITHQREILTKESREKAIHVYQLAKAISRTNRNIQRMNRF